MMYGQNYLQMPNYYTPQLYQNPQQLTQPQQTVTSQNLRDPICVDGLDGAYQCQIPSDVRSTIAYDIRRPIMYLIIVDGLQRKIKVYDYKDHDESQSTQKRQNEQESLKEIRDSLDSINNRLLVLEGTSDGSKFNSTDSKQSGNTKYNKSGNVGNAGRN